MQITYKNPLTKLYQQEYALYIAMCSRFRNTRCRSVAIQTLALYYAELVKENKDTGHITYKAQDELDDEMDYLVDRDVVGKVRFPDGDVINVSVILCQNRLHMFVFTGQTRSLMVRLGHNGIVAKEI